MTSQLDSSLTVSMNYPTPTALAKVIQDVAAWSHFNFVIDPSLNRQLQVFAPRDLPADEAFGLFVASLESIGLRAVHLDGPIIKIVPISLGKLAV